MPQTTNAARREPAARAPRWPAVLAWSLLGFELLLFQVLLPESSSLVVAGATLAVAALFQPLRRRVQAVVDRRFNRRRHDAGQLIEAFGARLRDQVDLDTLTGEVLAVVDQTMAPTRAWLWQRPPPAR